MSKARRQGAMLLAIGVALLCSYGTATAGDNCADPLTATIGLADLPWSDVGQTNCGRGYDYSSTCLGSYDGGEDIIYEITVTEAMDVNITVDPKGTPWAGVCIDLACPPGSPCLAYKTNGSSSAPFGIQALHLEPGIYYIMVDTYPLPYCIPSFDLTIAPYAIPTGACCEDRVCIGTTTQANCSGLWFSGQTCPAYSCPVAPVEFEVDPTPPAYEQSELTAIAISPTGWMVASGWAREFLEPTGSRYYPWIIERASPCGSWAALSPPDFGATWYLGNAVHYIPGTNHDLVVVGEYGPDPLSGLGNGFLVRLHRDAGTWDLRDISVPGYLFHFVRDAVLDPADPDVLWIAGTKGIYDGVGFCFRFEVLIVRYHLPSNTYTVAPTNQLGGLSSIVALEDGRVLTFGIQADECDYVDLPLALETQNMFTTVLPTPPPWPGNPAYRLNEAVVLSDGRVFAVGMASPTGGSDFATLAYGYDPDAQTWTPHKPLDPDTYGGSSGYYNQLFNVVEAPGGRIFAVGRYHDVYQGYHYWRTLIESFDGQDWTLHPVPSEFAPTTRSELWGVATTPAGQVFAVGETLVEYPQVTLAVKATTVPGDLDWDTDIDFEDFTIFAGCMSGPEIAPAPACSTADLDTDNDVDLADFATFQTVFGG